MALATTTTSTSTSTSRVRAEHEQSTFSIRTKFRGAQSSDGMAQPVLLYLYQNGGTGFIARDAVPRNVDWVDQWKVFLSRTASEHGGQTDKSGTKRVFSRILIGGPGTARTETYLVVGR